MLSVLLPLLVACVAGPSPARPGGLTAATVVYVDDGDTIDVQIDGRPERVRYIGIDAPEVPHHGQGGTRGGEAAAALNRAMVGRRRVGLELDVERRDRYGRLLAYIWLGPTMVNFEMVRRGYARALTIPPNLRYAHWFVSAESEARRAGRGLWESADLGGAPPPPSSLSRESVRENKRHQNQHAAGQVFRVRARASPAQLCIRGDVRKGGGAPLRASQRPVMYSFR